MLPLAPARPSRRDATSEPDNYVEPKKRFYASPDVADGTVTQTTDGERGFNVTVSRTVVGSNGKVRASRHFPSRYIPEDAIYLVGKGGTLPAGQTLSGLYPGYTGSTDGIDLNNWLAEPKPPKKKKPAAGDTVAPNGATPGATDGTTTGSTNPAVTTPTDTTPADTLPAG